MKMYVAGILVLAVTTPLFFAHRPMSRSERIKSRVTELSSLEECKEGAPFGKCFKRLETVDAMGNLKESDFEDDQSVIFDSLTYKEVDGKITDSVAWFEVRQRQGHVTYYKVGSIW